MFAPTSTKTGSAGGSIPRAASSASPFARVVMSRRLPRTNTRLPTPVSSVPTKKISSPTSTAT
jgi:hypothetical protein